MRNKGFIIILCLLTVMLGCDKHSSSTSKSVDNGAFNTGKSVYDVIEFSAKHSTSNADAKVQTLRSISDFTETEYQSTHKQQLIDSINTIFDGYDVTNSSARQNNEQDGRNLVKTLYDLIRDDSLPQLTNALGKMLRELSSNQENVKVLTDFLNTRCGLEPRAYLVLARKILQYRHSEQLLKAVATVVEQNPQLLREVFRLLSDTLTCLPADEQTSLIFMVLALEYPVQAEEMLGAPAWLSRLDDNGNPEVRSMRNSRALYPPFVDNDHDGNCDIDKNGDPVDEHGNALYIPAISKYGYKNAKGSALVLRDEFGRAVTPDGDQIFRYYNAKKTILGIVLYNVGEALQRDLAGHFIRFADIAFSKEGVKGYPLDSDGLQALVHALDLLKGKDPSTLALLKGFSALTDKNLQATSDFLVGFGKLLDKLSETELKDPNELATYMMTLIMTGEVPEMWNAMKAMKDVEIPDTGMMMDAYFVYWMGKNIDNMSSEVLWPLRKVIRKNPEVAGNLYFNTVVFLTGDFKSAVEGQRKLGPFLSVILELLIMELAENTDEKVTAIQDGLKSTVTSPGFKELVECFKQYSGSPEGKIVHRALVDFTTPKADWQEDVYGDLCSIVGMLQHKKEILPKIRLLRMIGRLIDPDKAVVINLLQVLGKIIKVDNAQIILNSLRATVLECQQYELEPLSMFTHASLAVYRVDYDKQKKNYKELLQEDVNNILHDLQDTLLNPNGLLQRIFAVLRNKR